MSTIGFATKSNSPQATSSTAGNPSAKRLVIIDPTVSDHQSLLTGIDPNTEVHILDPHRDGITQITEILQKAGNLGDSSQKAPLDKGNLGDSSQKAPLLKGNLGGSLHIISHGAPATLYLGNSTLELNNLQQNRHQLEKWHIAHLYIYIWMSSSCRRCRGRIPATTAPHHPSQHRCQQHPHRQPSKRWQLGTGNPHR